MRIRATRSDAGEGAALDRAIARVVAEGNCSGCGACTLLDSGLTMALDEDGYSRPTRIDDGVAAAGAVDTLRRACPGILVRAQNPKESQRHPTMGPVVQAWSAWAADPEIRRKGSSGGTITALAAWLVETGEAAQVVGAQAEAGSPRRTVSVSIMTRDEALAAAGSRYAPVSIAANPLATLAASAVVGKPCEASALRAMRPPGSADGPLLLSFYCAGTPSQSATDSLVTALGVQPGGALRDLWYRGRGWPGRFTAVTTEGTEHSASYDESWGDHLGPTVQWRCKICPDGIGESSDITAADFWRSDDRGYPDFTEGDGISALIARTTRGRDVVARAIAAGILVASPLSIEELDAVQPLQRKRRQTLAGRLAGARAAGIRPPRFIGFGLLAFAAGRLGLVARTARGTYSRVRADRSRSRRP